MFPAFLVVQVFDTAKQSFFAKYLRHPDTWRGLGISDNLAMKSLDALYLLNSVIIKLYPQSVLALENKRFCCPTPWFTFDLPGHRICSWEVLRSLTCVARLLSFWIIFPFLFLFWGFGFPLIHRTHFFKIKFGGKKIIFDFVEKKHRD